MNAYEVLTATSFQTKFIDLIRKVFNIMYTGGMMKPFKEFS